MNLLRFFRFSAHRRASASGCPAFLRSVFLMLFVASVLVCALPPVSPSVLAQDAPAAAAADDDEDFESLYFKANDLMRENNFEAAAETLLKAINSVGDFGWEDYGKSFGGVYFDYGTSLLQLGRYEDAKEAFMTCSQSEELAKDTKIPGENKRKSLALFEWGFCEDKLGNPEEALKLYQQYLNIPPPPEELELVRSSLALRLGSAYLHANKVAEGTAEIQKIFENKEDWKVGPQFLMQGLLELGLGWVDQADKNPDQAEGIETTANLFLDQHEESLQLSAFDKQRFGMIERLRKLGFDSGNVGMNALALRYYSMIPTTGQVIEDLKMRASQYGAAMPKIYADMIATEEAKLATEDPPQVELLRLVSFSWDRLGNRFAARAIYAHLVQNFPKSTKRAEILHEAARYSTMISDYSSAQYYGELFMAEMPEDHPLRENVQTFMLQSLFTAREYDLVIGIADSARERHELGAQERELSDFLRASSLYYNGKYPEAQPALDEFVKAYPDSDNLESALYYQASNQVVLGEFGNAAKLLDAFLAKYEKPKLLDLALYDRATCHFNAGEYILCIEKIERLVSERADSVVLDRAYNILGDALDAQSYDAPEDELKNELLNKSLEAYRQGIVAAQAKEAIPTGAEATAKAADVALRLEKWEEAVALYDSFFPTYAGSFWEPQLSVYSLEALEKVGRIEDGLQQLEKMIVVMGNQGPDEQDIDLLRRAIGSYSEKSVEHRGAEETVAKFDNFPGLDPSNQALLTWLQIQKVIVFQEMRKGLGKDTPEYAAIEKRIEEVFATLQQYDISNLSDFALQQVGKYLFEDTPFLAKRYFEELLNRNAPDFKVPAEFYLALIEMRGTDAAELNSAKERFKRVINEKDPEYISEAHLGLGRIALKTQEWAEAKENFGLINKMKQWFPKDKNARAESNLGYGIAFEEMGDIANAKAAYLNVLAVYVGYPEYSSVALERAFKLTYKEFDGKREEQKKAYAFLRRMVYIMSDTSDEAAPDALKRVRLLVPQIRIELSLTPEEQKAIDDALGIPEEKRGF